ncbi:hypothetical protein N7530_000792 [Penicillium desertorum]|uniref:Uncharacterized protein n=1 Tax=Penicillium desertorum TaxID=1303715 RepID=A0A9W9X8X7_9EURO|nr:hypothetical protein N7530_000792 [Penicillium desertorum]
MADDSQHPLWCKHCEVEGHSVIHCHALYEELTNFYAAFKMAQGQNSDPQNAHAVAHWGQGKKKKGKFIPRPYEHNLSVPGISCPSNPFARLSPWEADALANYLDQQWAYFLQWHAAWFRHNNSE